MRRTSRTRWKSSLRGFSTSTSEFGSMPIADSRFFGQRGSPYDFDGVNLNQARDQCRELESQQKGMGRKINTKVMNMIEGYVRVTNRALTV